MGDSAIVRRLQAVGDLDEDSHCFPNRERAMTEPLGQCLPLDQLHHQIGDVGPSLEFEQSRDVGVVQGRQHLRLGLELSQPLLAGVPIEADVAVAEPERGHVHRFRQHLDRHFATQLGVAGLVDLTHPSRTEGGDDRVLVQLLTWLERHWLTLILAPPPLESSQSSSSIPLTDACGAPAGGAIRSVTPFEITRGPFAMVALLVCSLCAVREADAEELQIGIIDFYGLGRVSVDEVRNALTFKEGDTLSVADGARSALVTESENRLAGVPGVARAHTDIVCCDEGRAIVYVGIEEPGSSTIRFRTAPRGTARLAADVVQAGDEFSTAMRLAVLRGDDAEDHSHGHAFVHDPAARAIQERFVVYAQRDRIALRRVLRSSSDAAQRALAAQVLGYASDKAGGRRRPGPRDERPIRRRSQQRDARVVGVRGRGAEREPIRPPHSVSTIHRTAEIAGVVRPEQGVFSAHGAFDGPGSPLLERLHRRTLTPLVEMARWKSEGHALPAFIILARIAGYSDVAALDLWRRGDREVVIGAAIDGQSADRDRRHEDQNAALIAACAGLPSPQRFQILENSGDRQCSDPSMHRVAVATRMDDVDAFQAEGLEGGVSRSRLRRCWRRC